MSTLSEQVGGNAQHILDTQTDRQTDSHAQHIQTHPSAWSVTATYLARLGAQTAARHPHRRTTVALNSSSAASRSSIGHGVRHLIRHGTCPGVRHLIRHGMGAVNLLVVSTLLGLNLTCNLHSNVTNLVSCVWSSHNKIYECMLSLKDEHRQGAPAACFMQGTAVWMIQKRLFKMSEHTTTFRSRAGRQAGKKHQSCQRDTSRPTTSASRGQPTSVAS